MPPEPEPFDVPWMTPVFTGATGGGGRGGAGGNGGRIYPDSPYSTYRNFTMSTEGMSGPTSDMEEITMRDAQPEKSEEKVFIDSMKKRLDAGEVIGKEDYRKFMRILKKKGHIDRSYRAQLHHIKDEDGKSMSAVSVDDLIPV